MDNAITKPSMTAVKAALDLIHKPGDVFEIRIPHATRWGTAAGYFDDTALAAQAAMKYNGKCTAIYVTANPVEPALLARLNNKIEVTKTLTSDSEITRRRWFLVDFDPKRPAGISSTDQELENARRKAIDVRDWLETLGWPAPLEACSGNGWHLMYRTDEPNDKEALADFEFALKMIASIFTDDYVDVDCTNFNAARVWKLYGTKAMKGDDTKERPHRYAQITNVPDVLEVLPRDKLSAMAQAMRDSRADDFKDASGEYISDMVKWLSDRGVSVVSGPRPLFGSEGQKWVLSHCPFNHSHKGPVVGLINNRPIYRCLHNSCSQNRWKEFREKIDPTFRDPETVYKRVLEWGESGSQTPDNELIQSTAAIGSKEIKKLFTQLKKNLPAARIQTFEAVLKEEQRRFKREVIGEGNEKGNIVGLINRTRNYQSEGAVPMYWTTTYDKRIRVGKVGDVDAEHFSENHEIDLLVKFHSAGDLWVKQTHCGQVIKYLSNEYCVNPIKIRLKSLEWDGHPRLDTWLSTYIGTVDSEYTRAVGRKWLISAVARAMDPGCQADHMLIFEGVQGIGKSRAFRIIGGQFYMEYSGDIKSSMAQKDMVHSTLGKMVVEMSEMATMHKSEIEIVKAMLTKTHDDVRLSYGHDSRAYPRTHVFCGCTNKVKQAYILDPTGARRFWPVVAGELKPIDHNLLTSDVEQLWAEAVHAYDAGETWWEVPKAEVEAEQAQRQITVENSDPWYSRVYQSITNGDYFSDVYEAIRDKDNNITEIRVINVSVALSMVLGVDTARQTSADATRIGSIFREIGFDNTRLSKPWRGSSRCYRLSKSSLPHLWPAIEGAVNSVMFPKRSNEKTDS